MPKRGLTVSARPVALLVAAGCVFTSILNTLIHSHHKVSSIFALPLLKEVIHDKSKFSIRDNNMPSYRIVPERTACNDLA